MFAKRALSWLAIASIVGGCGATTDQLRARAAFDLNCSESKIQLIRIDDRTQGAAGCGQRAAYVESCGMIDGYGGKHDCTWVLNTTDTRRNGSGD